MTLSSVNKQQSLRLAKKGNVSHFYGSGNVLFLPVFRHGYEVVSFVSCSTVVSVALPDVHTR